MNVFISIPTRSGAILHDVYLHIERAAQYAKERGISSASVLSRDRYSVAQSRNKAVAGFMQREEFTHLLFIDSDVLIQEDAIVRLLEMNTDIAAGCYPSTKSPVGIEHMYVPYLTLLTNERQWYRDWFDGVREVDGAGTGCMLLSRKVLEEVGFPWFRWPTWLDDEGFLNHNSDDIDFCKRARELGFKVYAHGNVRCGHMKTVDVSTFIVDSGEQAWPVSWTGPKTVEEQQRWPRYGSHVPALCSIAESFTIRNVIEYGGGHYSTPAFLNKVRFPDLENLTILENSQRWYGELASCYRDARLTLALCTLDEMTTVIRADADLVFIDCDAHQTSAGVDYSVRVQLLKCYEDSDAIVVLHDIEEESLAAAFEEANYRFKTVFTPTHGPPTGVMSNTLDVTTIVWGAHPRTAAADAGYYETAVSPGE